MAKVKFKKSVPGKLEGRNFPKVGEVREVSEAMLPGLRKLGFVEDVAEAPKVEPETAAARETREVKAPETRKRRNDGK